MNIHVARVVDGVVVNFEVASEEWVAENTGVDGVTFVPYDPSQPPEIGSPWTEGTDLAVVAALDGAQDYDEQMAEFDAMLADYLAKHPKAVDPNKPLP